MSFRGLETPKNVLPPVGVSDSCTPGYPLETVGFRVNPVKGVLEIWDPFRDTFRDTLGHLSDPAGAPAATVSRREEPRRAPRKVPRT